MVSPSRTAAIGPPRAASGEMWPIRMPWRHAGKAAVGDQRDVFAEAPPLQLDREHHHLGHAGPADRADIAHHDHVARHDLAGADRRHRLGLGLEHARRAAELALLERLA